MTNDPASSGPETTRAAQPVSGPDPYPWHGNGPSPHGGPGGFPYPPGTAGFPDASEGSSALSLASMIIGLVSLVFVGWLVVPQVVGIVFGHIGLVREQPQGRSFAVTGLITGYLALLIYAGIWIVGLFLLRTIGGYEYSTRT